MCDTNEDKVRVQLQNKLVPETRVTTSASWLSTKPGSHLGIPFCFVFIFVGTMLIFMPY